MKVQSNQQIVTESSRIQEGDLVVTTIKTKKEKFLLGVTKLVSVIVKSVRLFFKLVSGISSQIAI